MGKQQVQYLYMGHVLEVTPFGVDVRLPNNMIYVATKVSLEEALEAVHEQLSLTLPPALG